jgi:hypothetical protein
LFTGRLSVNRKMPCPGFILNMALLFGFRPGTRRIPSPDFGTRRIPSPDFGSRRIFSPDSEVQSNPIISYFLILLFLIYNCCFTDLGKSASPGTRRILSPDSGSRRIPSPDSEVQSNPIISYFLILLFLICNCCFTDFGKSASPGSRRIPSPDSGKCSDLLQCFHGLWKIRVPQEQENPFS